MKQRFLAVAVLTGVCGLAQADNLSNANGSSIDIFQVANTVSNGGTVDITSVDQAQVNLVSGNSDSNTIAITQTAALTRANVVMGAQLPDGGNMSAGDRGTGAIEDISAAAIGQLNSTFDNSDAAAMNGSNIVTVNQDGEGAVANLAIDGSGNTVTLTQAVAGSVVNAVISATGTAYTIAQ